LAPFEWYQRDGFTERLFYQSANTPPHAWRQLLAFSTADISGGVLKQLLPIVLEGRFLSADRRIDFREAMATIRVPVRVVAGRLDRLAPAPAVRDGFDALAGPKQWKMVSVANGAAAEYGHMDLVLGTFAADDVWAPALAFLNAR
jgi:poly(3-hydroxyalkanoate) synthetase